jgi:hypothetical protein
MDEPACQSAPAAWLVPLLCRLLLEGEGLLDDTPDSSEIFHMNELH